MFRKTAWLGLHIVLCHCFYMGGCDVDFFRSGDGECSLARRERLSDLRLHGFSSSVGACDRLYARDPFVLYR